MMNSAHSPVEPKKSGMTRSIFRTLFMPEIKLSFGTTGMTHRAFLSIIATMFIQAGLLPYNHPARSMETIGHTTFRSIMGDAWYNLRNSGKNDFHQYGLFFAVFLLLSMAIMMVVTFAGQLFVSTASAQIPGGLFSSPAPDTDLGLDLIEHLIGAASRGEGSPHAAMLGQLFSMYSYGVLVIASFIVAWSVISIVVDTAATGKFFGGRHNPVWWPIRLVFGLALLVPLGFGFNAGQYMVIQIAKWGSNLASNAWYVYVEAVVTDGTKSYITQQYPTARVFNDFKNIGKINICQEAINKTLKDKGEDPASHDRAIRDTMVGGAASPQIEIMFGEIGAGGSPWNPFNLRFDKDKCGKITLARPAAWTPDTLGGDPNDHDWNFLSLANRIMMNSNMDDRFFQAYFNLYNDAIGQTNAIANQFVETYFASGAAFNAGDVPMTLEPLKNRYDMYFTEMDNLIQQVASVENQAVKNIIGEVKTYGWPTASLWYYIISSSNEKLSEAFQASAGVEVGYHKFEDFRNPSAGNRRRAQREGRNAVAESLETQRVYKEYEAWWNNQISLLNAQIEAQESPAPQDRVLSTAIKQEDTDDASIPKNAEEFQSMIANTLNVSTIVNNFQEDIKHGFEAHPIVLMAYIGQKMISYAEMIILAGYGLASVVALFGGVSVFGSQAAVALSTIIAMLVSVIFLIVGPLMIGGVILSIILPMTPFIRFVFAISGWLIAIIEAIVMVPIVALGHLRTDGEGIMGPMVQGSYVMMLQLLLRPVLIVIGLVLSMFLVEVTVNYVNQMFFAMLDTLPVGSSKGVFLSALVRFVGFGVMYGVIMYGLINSSFKLVDILPEAVVKYLGGGPSGGITDRDEGDINRAVLASAVFASQASSPVKPLERPRENGDDAATKGKPKKS